MSFPVFETQRLALTELRPSDEASIFTLFSDQEVVRYYDLEPFTVAEQARELIGLFRARYQAGSGIRWAIRIKHAETLIGTCGFNSWSTKMQNAVIGYDLMPIHWGKGYAGEAVRHIIQAAFTGVLPCGALHRIQADTEPGNHASEALLRRLGFKEEGLRRECGYWKNRFHDLKCFGLLRHEFTEVQNSNM